jgi:hypothetical protein
VWTNENRGCYHKRTEKRKPTECGHQSVPRTSPRAAARRLVTSRPRHRDEAWITLEMPLRSRAGFQA